MVSRENDALDDLRTGDVKAAVSSVNYPIPNVTSHPLGTQTFIATASPTFVSDHFSDGMIVEALQIAPTVSYSQYPSLCTRMAKTMLGSSLALPMNLLPSSFGVLHSCLDGLAWGMNPIHLAREHIDSGALVNLWPNEAIELPLYWHISDNLDKLLGDVTATVYRAAHDLQLKPLHQQFPA